MKYTALLRGINVGGNNKVEMAKLRATFEALGFKNVSTYINSGNIFFTTNSSDQSSLVAKIEKAIKKDFGLDIRVVLREFKNIEKLNNEIDKNWLNDKEMKTDVMFLWDEFDKAEIIKELVLRPEVDEVRYLPGALIWRVDREEINKSGMLKIVGTKLYKNMTIRNINTLRKLYSIMSEMKE